MAVIASRGYRSKLANVPVYFDNGTASNNKLIIFKGTIPSNITDWVEADNSADKLVEYTGFTFAVSTVGDKDRTIFGTSPPITTVNAVATGTAAWYAYVNAGVVTRYFFGTVTLNSGIGTLHLDSLSLVSGNPATLEGWATQFVA